MGIRKGERSQRLRMVAVPSARLKRGESPRVKRDLKKESKARQRMERETETERNMSVRKRYKYLYVCEVVQRHECGDHTERVVGVGQRRSLHALSKLEPSAALHVAHVAPAQRANDSHDVRAEEKRRFHPCMSLGSSPSPVHVQTRMGSLHCWPVIGVHLVPARL